jgi:hypothetical protein
MRRFNKNSEFIKISLSQELRIHQHISFIRTQNSSTFSCSTRTQNSPACISLKEAGSLSEISSTRGPLRVNETFVTESTLTDDSEKSPAFPLSTWTRSRSRSRIIYLDTSFRKSPAFSPSVPGLLRRLYSRTVTLTSSGKVTVKTVTGVEISKVVHASICCNIVPTTEGCRV